MTVANDGFPLSEVMIYPCMLIFILSKLVCWETSLMKKVKDKQ